MNDLEAQKGKFLMRRIEYTPDYANIYCDINIKWLQEIYFYSIINMPKVLFDEEKFKTYYICTNFISIDLEEWTNFLSKVASAFRSNRLLRFNIIKNVNEYLAIAEKSVNKLYEKVYKNGYIPSLDEVKKCFEYFINMDCFAVFNMCIPSNYYEKIFKQLKVPDKYANIDMVMICSFLPHRLQVRKNKLELIKEKIKNDPKINNHIKEYLFNYAVYEKFESTAFDNSFITNDMFIRRELKLKSNEYTLEQIEKELIEIETKRKIQINDMNIFYKKIKECMEKVGLPEEERRNIIEQFSFLTLIVSEEERRHMIECKIFAIMAKIFSLEDIDIARNSIKNILDIYKKL